MLTIRQLFGKQLWQYSRARAVHNLTPSARSARLTCLITGPPALEGGQRSVLLFFQQRVIYPLPLVGLSSSTPVPCKDRHYGVVVPPDMEIPARAHTILPRLINLRCVKLNHDYKAGFFNWGFKEAVVLEVR